VEFEATSVGLKLDGCTWTLDVVVARPATLDDVMTTTWLFVGLGSKREYAYDACIQGSCSAASDELLAVCDTEDVLGVAWTEDVLGAAWTEDVLAGRPGMYVH